MQIVRLEERHLRFCARLQREVIPAARINELGEGFLSECYFRSFIESPAGFGWICEVDGEPVGHVAAASELAAFRGWLKWAHPLRLGWTTLRAVAARPTRVVSAVRLATFERPLREPPSEIMTLAVARGTVGGAGLLLLREALLELGRRGVSESAAMIWDERSEAEPLYRLCGFSAGESFTVHRQGYRLMRLNDLQSRYGPG